MLPLLRKQPDNSVEVRKDHLVIVPVPGYKEIISNFLKKKITSKSQNVLVIYDKLINLGKTYFFNILVNNKF